MGLRSPFRSLLLSLLPLLLPAARGEAVFATSAAPASEYTGVQAFNPTTLIPPPVPTPAIPTNIPVTLQKSGTQGLSIAQDGAFMGFSVEMSVTNQVMGKNSTLLQVAFLNLMASLVQRAGSVRIRLGGNSQETAKLVDSLQDGRILAKNLTGVFGPTSTPPLDYTRDLMYTLGNISALLNIDWIVGIPWFVTNPFDLSIIPLAQSVLGDHLLGFQAGNEPDMYVQHGHRVPPEYPQYTPYDYGGEMSDFLTQLAASGFDPNGTSKDLLVAPNIAWAAWSPQDVWDSGFVDKFDENLKFLSVEKYPVSNCGAMIHDNEVILDPQTVFPDFLQHDTHITSLISQYVSSTAYAQTKNKPFIMTETNQAACGGIVGVSDVFGAALWSLDYALQLAHSNFSSAFFHTGGEHVFYNPFTAPPTNQSTFRKWTVGPIYYAALAMAETIGRSNQSQVLDLTPSLQNISAFTPVYGIYQDGAPVRVAAFNYVDDPSGASDVTFSLSVSDTGTPAQVKVKYLAAKSVSQKGGYTWANQTLGGVFESDGRLVGDEDIQTVQCVDAVCAVKVPAPGFALVYLTDEVFSEAASAADGSGATVTFPTTAKTQTHNTATVDPLVLATSNGHDGSIDGMGSTSRGKKSNGASRTTTSAGAAAVLAGLVFGAGMMWR
ncbi:glycoside hydrolase family 79 protein [Mycena amicta]|nr:glycoside hydrolase family 79 protein [Mycena amicta]